MKRIAVLILILLPLCQARAMKLDYDFVGFGQKKSGFTQYHIQFPTEVLVTDGINIYLVPATGHSVLSFPLDGYETGIRFSAFTTPKHRSSGRYGLEVSMSKTLIQPSEAMVDSDWVEVPDIYLDKFVFGATKSEARVSDLKFSAAAGIRLNINPKVEWTGTAGYTYFYYRYEMTGLSGWYDFDFNGSPEPVDVNELAGTNVLDYKVKYHILNLRTRFEMLSSEGLKLFIDGQWFPYVKALDLDDHLLRFKTGKSSCQGSGYSIEGGTKLSLHAFPGGSKINLGGSYAMTRIKATGAQVQRYYGDDPSSDEVDTGLVIEGIDNAISLKQNTLTILVEYQF